MERLGLERGLEVMGGISELDTDLTFEPSGLAVSTEVLFAE